MQLEVSLKKGNVREVGLTFPYSCTAFFQFSTQRTCLPYSFALFMPAYLYVRQFRSKFFCFLMVITVQRINTASVMRISLLDIAYLRLTTSDTWFPSIQIPHSRTYFNIGHVIASANEYDGRIKSNCSRNN